MDYKKRSLKKLKKGINQVQTFFLTKHNTQ